VGGTEELLALSRLPGMGPKAWAELRRRCPLHELGARFEEHAELWPGPARIQWRSGQARDQARAEAERAAALGMRLVGLCDEQYPALLRETFDPPLVLYVRGSLAALGRTPAVAVVGSRAATPQGKELARAMARELAAAGALVVSGLARGIDGAAHQGALDAPGATLAVLGCGLDRIYPPEHAALAEAIAAAGALVSELPLGAPPYPQHFPRRNRIIAGLVRAVIVVEATGKSGSLSTARHALDSGREVFAVPGHPSRPEAEGTNHLIRDGAALVRGAQDVADELGLRLAVPAAQPADLVLRALERGCPLSLEEIQARSGRPMSELMVRITELELGERVRRLPGPLFVLA
jgi:DNA processing protein